MELRPIDLLNKTFSRKVRGYDAVEVEEFLRGAASSFDQSLDENNRQREKLKSLEAELQRYKELESTLNSALVMAQKTADDMRANAQREAELIVREAKETINRDLEEARRELEELHRSKDRFTVEFRTLLQSHLEMCEDKKIG